MSDQQTIQLLVTSGDGPQECRRAVSLCLRQIEKEAKSKAIKCETTIEDKQKQKDPASAIITLKGKDIEAFANLWIGTIKWTAPSPFRPHHKRRNWFIGIFTIDQSKKVKTEIKEKDLRFDSFKAGGPGGQHQNTTDSAIRLTHLPTGYTVLSRDERSQHHNKKVARERMQSLLFLKQSQQNDKEKKSQNHIHKQLERGNPVREFKGIKFRES